MANGCVPVPAQVSEGKLWARFGRAFNPPQYVEKGEVVGPGWALVAMASQASYRADNYREQALWASPCNHV